MYPTVVVTDTPGHGVGPERELVARAGATLVDGSAMDDAELSDAIRSASAILTCFRRVTAEHVLSAAQLQIVARYGVGVDNIAVDTATSRGILVTNVPDYCVDEVADHALALTLALTRGVATYDRSVRAGEWKLGSAAPLRRTSELVFGVVGFGRIGANVERKASALGFQVVVCDHGLVARSSTESGSVVVSFDDIVRRADVLSLHVPLTESTHHLLGAEQFAAMKSSAVVINVSRGALIDETALIDALLAGDIGAAGLDVAEVEPMPANHPLRRIPNALVTPHVAYYSEESLHELQVRAATSVATMLSGVRPSNIVNGL